MLPLGHPEMIHDCVRCPSRKYDGCARLSSPSLTLLPVFAIPARQATFGAKKSNVCNNTRGTRGNSGSMAPPPPCHQMWRHEEMARWRWHRTTVITHQPQQKTKTLRKAKLLTWQFSNRRHEEERSRVGINSLKVIYDTDMSQTQSLTFRSRTQTLICDNTLSMF